MDFPFQNCIVSDSIPALALVRKLLAYQHAIGVILIDLAGLSATLQGPDEENIVNRYLCHDERSLFRKMTSVKRKRDWLGGRFAAKYAAAEVLVQPGNPAPWSALAILPDENGRPFVSSSVTTFPALPDISISHSGDLAVAMAVGKGLCGIDIQIATERILRVRERFCTWAEEQLLQPYCKERTAALTMLWAAKETLRKVANSSSLPGFMELELQEVIVEQAQTAAGFFRFIINWKHPPENTAAKHAQCTVLVSSFADYALALTIRNDTLD